MLALQALGRWVSLVTEEKMLYELRRQGGLLKKIFTESNGKYSGKVAVVLENINKFIESLERKVLN